MIVRERHDVSIIFEYNEKQNAKIKKDEYVKNGYRVIESYENVPEDEQGYYLLHKSLN